MIIRPVDSVPVRSPEKRAARAPAKKPNAEAGQHLQEMALEGLQPPRLVEQHQGYGPAAQGQEG